MNPSFTAKVYEIVKQIPPGKVATYGDVAALAGSPKAARAVGAAMKNNPDPASIPCHRVVGTDGKMHGYAFGGMSVKEKLLTKEGAAIVGDRVDLAQSRWMYTGSS